MPRSAISLRLDEALWERAKARADELGQSYTVFVSRALEQALSGVPEVAAAGAFEDRMIPPSSREETEKILVSPPKRIPPEDPRARQGKAGAVDGPGSLPKIARKHWVRDE